ncbi:MAG: 23S rRNA (pseudouridine(1915)-N(3))-methyltransferase RlmH [Candidatus Gracilibacteria bacterium]|nr:23S rRNA (pseudouridine(1915)-N(3))-methyltransferase RlmH [bacterium]MDZ4216908.1 23S rRNA (pseudouridine(1915)-N(3))-methyltransferase RlmH [Candidatus Gracilibacteria bacterium]
MSIRILLLGKNKGRYMEEGVADFAQRLTPLCELELEYLKDEKVHDNVNKVLDKEADRILGRVQADEYLIVLDDKGKSFTTEKLADHFSQLKDKGIGKFVMVIGSAHGLSERVKSQADVLLSLSPLTMNHQIVRLVLLEQIYRIFTLHRGMKYHK